LGEEVCLASVSIAAVLEGASMTKGGLAKITAYVTQAGSEALSAYLSGAASGSKGAPRHPPI
jgi:hypothetical protein